MCVDKRLHNKESELVTIAEQYEALKAQLTDMSNVKLQEVCYVRVLCWCLYVYVVYVCVCFDLH